MTERDEPAASDVFWAKGCGVLVAAALIWAVLRMFLDLVLVARAQRHCPDGLDAGEGFAGVLWAVGWFAVFPVASIVSVLVSLPVGLIARLPRSGRRPVEGRSDGSSRSRPQDRTRGDGSP
ncbi:hypothetical protein GCM10010466_31610 [Planomonospora alba]|uniref:Uncharacterized protein n=1 Tax=Planomonospora alba TaxID=161354 RepID=A0ABP6N8M1_9ACTN